MTRLAAEQLSLAYNGRRVVDTATMALAPGEMLALVGPNGAGKSSLVRALAGLIAPAGGRVTLGGDPVAGLAPQERARRLAYLPQEAQVHWPITVRRLVALGRLPHLDAFHRPREADEAAILRAMAATGVEAFADRPATQISAGERARVLLARALAAEAPLLLADEPVAALDPYHQLHVMELLAGQAEQGRGILVVLHDLALAVRFCPRILLMHEGALVADGPAEAVLSDANLRATYGIRAIRGAGWLLPTERVARGDRGD